MIILNNLFVDWNENLNLGNYEIVFDEYPEFIVSSVVYDKPKTAKTRSGEAPAPLHVDLLKMTAPMRYISVWRACSSGVGFYIGELFVLNFGKVISGFHRLNRYYVTNACSVFSTRKNNCHHNKIVYANTSDYADRMIRKLYNANHLVLASAQEVYDRIRHQ